MGSTQRSRISEVLANVDGILDTIRDLAETGASLGTIEAKCMLPVGILKKWMVKGQEKPKSPFGQFFMLYRSWVADARAAAEAQQLAKTPTQWLERNTSSRLLDTPDDITISNLPVPTAPVPAAQFSADALLLAVKKLRESGISFDEAVDKNLVSIQPEGLPAPKGISDDEFDELDEQ